ncbi:hypothetical protein [Nocardia paucivorans]|uniref:hypothetical protein n=1 Tax=Nocardia paucivorans TaxID=114259 RepID=UPI0002F6C54D|nr:hypothetical protein [Nocardia paucivorans]
MRAELEAMRYTVHVTGRRLVVDRYAGQPDYSAVITAAFARFHPDDESGRPEVMDPRRDMNEVEEQIVDRVAVLYPRAFGQLTIHTTRYRDFLDPVVDRFDVELRFYLDYLEFVRQPATRGLPFCYPDVTTDFEGIHAEDAYDAALARVTR